MKAVQSFLSLIWAIVVLGVNADDWQELFKNKLYRGAYKQEETIKNWKLWMKDGILTMLCTNKRDSAPTIDGESLLGKTLTEEQKCTTKCHLSFKRSEKTLLEVFEILWGFSNVGLYQRDRCSRYFPVEISMKGDLKYNFEMQYKRSQIMIILKEEGKSKGYLPYKGILKKIDRELNKQIEKVSIF